MEWTGRNAVAGYITGTYFKKELIMLQQILSFIQTVLTPYTLEDFIKDMNPQSNVELEHLERMWERNQVNRY